MDSKTWYFRPRIALEGRIDFRLLYWVLVFNLVIGFLSYATFNTLAEHSMVQEITSIGSRISPSVDRLSALSRDPSRCAFVLSVQWVLCFLYLLLLLSVYWPFSKIMRVAVMEWRKRQPPESISENNALKFFLFFALLAGWALGDLGVIGFPTLYNGLILSGGEHLRAFVAMINSGFWLPVLAWFSAFATVVVYWSAIYVAANWKSLVQ